MSGYGNMDASPFWKGVMRLTGILCLLTLLTPPAYYFKYLLFDAPGEAAAATAANAPATPPLSFHYVALEINRADAPAPPSEREQAISWLGALVLTSNAQVTHPVECMLAKSTLSSLATSRANPAVRVAASDALTDVAEKGAVIER